MWAGFCSHYRPGDQIAGTVDANGKANGALGPCPEGWLWYVERANAWSNTATATGLLELFVVRVNAPPAGTDKGGLQGTFWKTDVQHAERSWPAPIVLPAGYFLIASWSGLTQSDLVAVTFQVRVHELEKHERHVHGARHHHLLGHHDAPATAGQ